MNKIAAIGEKETILFFRSLGIDVYPYTDAYNIKNLLQKKDYPIYLITENQAEKIKDSIQMNEKEIYPIILTIPGAGGNSGK